MTTLLLADHDNRKLADATRRAVTAAQALGGEIHILVAGEDCRTVAEEAAAIAGVGKVLLAEAPALAQHLAEPLGALLVSLAGGYAALVAAATSNGKNVMPRVAALLDVMQVSDISKVLSADTFERPIYAGNAIETVQATDAIKVLTIRASAFAAAPPGGAAGIEAIAATVDGGGARFLRNDMTGSVRPELGSAKVVVAGGRALGSAENFDRYILPLADRLGAAVGASRAAVDAGYCDNALQVGQTGKVVAPDLYVAVGISGAIQHLAGMKGAKVIVAINKDGEAPIFQVADYGLVGDLFTLLPELEAALAG